MNILETIKSKVSGEVGQLKQSLQEVTADRDLQLAKLKEYEDKNKDYIESAQTADQMKQAHATELESLKAEYEAKLAEKDKELATIKESLVKEVETVKAESEKTISSVKQSVAAESIALVCSQGTNIVIKENTNGNVKPNSRFTITPTK